MSTCCVKDIVEVLDAFAPSNLAETWDKIGLQIGQMDTPVQGVLITLDPTQDCLEYAFQQNCNFVVCHHPFFFSPATSVNTSTHWGRSLQFSLKHEINIFVAHTNWDSTSGGINDVLAQALGLEQLVPLQGNQLNSSSGALKGSGLGRVGTLPKEITLTELANRVKEALGIQHLRMVGLAKSRIQKVALCGGSGGKMVHLAREHQADCYITADIGYHTALESLYDGPSLIDPGHFSMEQFAVPRFASELRDQLSKKNISVKVKSYEGAKDPFQFI